MKKIFKKRVYNCQPKCLITQSLPMSYYSYLIPQGPTSALSSSRKNVKQRVYFQILQNAEINWLFLTMPQVFPDHTHLLFLVTCWEKTDLLTLLCVMFSWVFVMWCPGSGVILDCIVSWSLPSYLLWSEFGKTGMEWVHIGVWNCNFMSLRYCLY